jgi:hypothetical protein
MGGILRIIGLLIFAASAFAQGTIYFNNRTSSGDVRFNFWNGNSIVGLGEWPGGMTAQLFLSSPASQVLTPLSPASAFSDSSPNGSYFITPVVVTVPNVPAGSPATVVLRVWPATDGSYDNAVVKGQSAPVTISALGGVNPETGAIVPMPDLAGIQSFTIFIPEPSTIALLIVSAAAALLYRRRE